MGVVATMAGGEARSGRRGGGELGPEERGWRGENEIGFDGWLKQRREQRHGDAWTRTPRSCSGASRGDGGDGSLVINLKFQNAVCKFSFSPSSLPQMKNS